MNFDGCPNLFGESILVVKSHGVRKYPHLDDEELLEALSQAEQKEIVRLLEKDLKIKNAEERLIRGDFGMKVEGNFFFHSIHEFLDALEDPGLVPYNKRQVILPIIRAFLKVEITEIIERLKEKKIRSSLPNCA